MVATENGVMEMQTTIFGTDQRTSKGPMIENRSGCRAIGAASGATRAAYAEEPHLMIAGAA